MLLFNLWVSFVVLVLYQSELFVVIESLVIEYGENLRSFYQSRLFISYIFFCSSNLLGVSPFRCEYPFRFPFQRKSLFTQANIMPFDNKTTRNS